MATREKTQKKSSLIAQYLPFTRENWILFFVGLAVLILGYVALSWGHWDSWMSLNMAPFLLVLAYCVIFPVAILYRKREKASE